MRCRLAIPLALLLAGCGNGHPDLSHALPDLPEDTRPAAASRVVQAGSAAPAPAATDTLGSEWTAGVTERSRSGMRPVTIRAVRSARNAAWDRTVWEFAGDSLPGYHMEYVDRPVRRCGSGATAQVAGQGWLEVRLQPARGHDDAGRSTLLPVHRSRTVNFPVLRQVEQTCDFEAVATWVLGVAAPNRYRVLELRDPARLVVDVRH